MKLIRNGATVLAFACGFLLPMAGGAQDYDYGYYDTFDDGYYDIGSDDWYYGSQGYGSTFSKQEYDDDDDWVENEYQWQDDDLFADEDR